MDGIINALATRKVVVADLALWIAQHTDDLPGERASRVIQCLDCRPPEGFRVLRVLSNAGHTKIVFKASWDSRQREVALKKLVAKNQEQQIHAELFAHGLSVRHHNIIETYFFQNSEQETFLAEELLDDIVDENCRLGDGEIANLLRDILRALAALEDERYVHEDIKPGNVGRSDQRYLLLDFGTSQPVDEAMYSKPTGSIRTRAPELLLESDGHSCASDLWALGATVYRLLCGRYPLTQETDVWPGKLDEPGRQQMLEKLQQRAKDQYDELVNIHKLPAPFRTVLATLLARNPKERRTARELLQSCDDTLGGYLRSGSESRTFSRLEELDRLYRFLQDSQSLALMSYNDQRSLHSTLLEIERSPGLDEASKERIRVIRARLPLNAQ